MCEGRSEMNEMVKAITFSSFSAKKVEGRKSHFSLCSWSKGAHHSFIRNINLSVINKSTSEWKIPHLRPGIWVLIILECWSEWKNLFLSERKLIGPEATCFYTMCQSGCTKMSGLNKRGDFCQPHKYNIRIITSALRPDSTRMKYSADNFRPFRTKVKQRLTFYFLNVKVNPILPPCLPNRVNND